MYINVTCDRLEYPMSGLGFCSGLKWNELLRAISRCEAPKLAWEFCALRPNLTYDSLNVEDLL